MPNGAPDFNDIPRSLAAIWGEVRVVNNTIAGLQCDKREEEIEALQDDVRTLQGQADTVSVREKAKTARWNSTLTVALKIAALAVAVITSIWGGTRIAAARNGQAPAPRPATQASP